MRNSITGTANITNSIKTLAANSDKKEETVQFMWSEGCVPMRGLTHSWNTSGVPKVYLQYICLLSFCHGSSMSSTDCHLRRLDSLWNLEFISRRLHLIFLVDMLAFHESGDLQIPFVFPLLVIIPPLLLIHVCVSPPPETCERPYHAAQYHILELHLWPGT